MCATRASERLPVIFFQPFAHIHTHEPSLDDKEMICSQNIASVADAFDRLFLIKPNMTDEEIHESNAKREQLSKFCRDRPAAHRSVSCTRCESDRVVLGQKRKAATFGTPLDQVNDCADGSKLAKSPAGGCVER